MILNEAGIVTRTVSSAALVLALAACGGGGGGEDPPAFGDDPSEAPPELAADAESALYTATLSSLWFAEDYPQDFPDGEVGSAHLSHVGGATHNAAVSFWEPGETLGPGVEDIAETGRIEIFLAEEAAPAIENGTADSAIAFREYIFSSPYTRDIGLPTEKSFEIEMRRPWPLLTLVTMLGPSPDWFVGVSGLALHEDGAWHDALTLELPLLDGGTKSGLSPVMGGPDVVPPEPVRPIAYDPATGTYGPTDTPQILARLVLERVR